METVPAYMRLRADGAVEVRDAEGVWRVVSPPPGQVTQVPPPMQPGTPPS